MFARLTIMKIKPGHMKDVVARTHAATLPGISEKKGFHGAILLTERRGGKSIGITLWDTEEDLIDTEESVHYPIAMLDYTDILEEPFVREVYEVSAKTDDI
jgi:heme-degrading monooxygenase HmoA